MTPFWLWLIDVLDLHDFDNLIEIIVFSSYVGNLFAAFLTFVDDLEAFCAGLCNSGWYH